MTDQNSRRTSMLSSIISAIWALMLFTLIYLPLEFQITEVWMWTPRLSPIIGSFFLVFLIIILGLIKWQKLIFKNFFWVMFVIILVAGSYVFRVCRQKKMAREYLPKIYKIDHEWGIQAQTVKISGVNFYPVWKKGKVMVGDQEMLVRWWDEKSIVAEQQVPVEFGLVKLYIIRSDGVESNKVLFEIKNPGELSD